MRLYEIYQKIVNCSNIDELNKIQLEPGKKTEMVALYIKNLEAEADAIKCEEFFLANRRYEKEKKAEILKTWLAGVLNGQGFETSKVRLSFFESEKVDVTDRIELFKFIAEKSASDDRYNNLIDYSFEPNKAKIEKLLKAGEKIPGVTLVTNQHLKIE